MLWKGQLPLTDQEKLLVGQFTEKVDKEYGEILESLQQKDADLRTLASQYQQVKTRDYFQSNVGKKVYESLVAAREAEWQ